jgi:CRISPR-associated protein Cas5h
MGLLGAVIGLGGYNQQGENMYPEFYEELHKLKVAIIPNSKNRGLFNKKIQTFNNSVGYASKEEGNNLVVREQWIEDVEWKIIINLESDIKENIKEKLKNYLLEYKAEYIPYLGKNDHPADIQNVEIFDAQEISDPENIDSLFYLDKIKLESDAVIFETPFLFKDYMPVSLNEEKMYEFKKIAYTNRLVKNNEDCKLYKHGSYNFTFI